MSSGPLILIQIGRMHLAEGRILDRRLAADLVDVGHLGRVLGDGLAEALVAGPLGGQDAALAPFPGGLLLD